MALIGATISVFIRNLSIILSLTVKNEKHEYCIKIKIINPLFGGFEFRVISM